MIKPDMPANESARLDALHQLKILDTAAEKSYDRTVSFIAEQCEVPIALVSLIDAERQWFKARHGLDACETSRDVSFCGHAILQPEIFEVPDAQADERFADNPLVVGPPHVRFYAGMPLVDAHGLQLGTLCLIDTRPRRLTESQRALLRYCAEHVSLLLNMRATHLALAEAREQALAASRSKDRFLTTISHELRTPLHGMLGIAQLLTQGLPAGQSQEYGHKLLLAGDHLHALLNELLDLARIEAGEFKIESRAFSLATLIGEVLALHQHSAHAKGLNLRLEPLPPDVPAQLRGDPLRLRQMLNNLISNAIKFTDVGQVGVRLSHIADVQAGALRLRCEVIDTGPGIAPELMGRLFKPFSQLDDSRTRSQGGSGLGLSIVRQLAQLMGGDAGVTSAPGKGALFWFEIQLESAATAANVQPVQAAALVAPRDTAGRHVLIAEDSELGAELLQTALERAGYRVSHVTDGLQAVEMVTAASPPPDAVLMDCNMPQLDGLEATRRIRAWEARQGRDAIPVIALTADAFEDTHRQCLAAGMSSFLSKPVRFDQLLETLGQSLSTRTAASTPTPSPAAAIAPPSPAAGFVPATAQVLNTTLALERLGNKRDLYLRFAAAVVQQLDQDMGAVRTAVESFEHNAADPAAAERLRKASHRFKGVLATLGAEIAQALCAALEEEGRQRNVQPVRQLLLALEEALVTLRPVLNGLLNEAG